jgi:hypothetical protein
MKAKTVKEVLVAAKWLLQNYDWNQAAWYITTDGLRLNSPEWFIVARKQNRLQLKSCCISGAVQLVNTDKDTKEMALLSLQSAARTDNIINWNDWNGRTKEQVIKLLDKAIEKA